MVTPGEQSSLAEWLTWLEQLHPREIELGLERLHSVASRLWEMPVMPGVRVVTVAGTNGKGSCIEALQRLLLASGQRVASYTSPHLVRFNERVCVDAVPVDDQRLVRAMTEVECARAEAGCALTFFEFTTLVALQIFRDETLNYLLLEVGLGGRLDAVNLIDPDIAVITAIGLDHCDWLGEDRESIAREKAGILRPGITAILADPQPPQSLYDEVLRVGARAYWIGQDFSCETVADKWNWTGTDKYGEQLSLSDLPVPELPEASAAAAMQVLSLEGLLPESGTLHRVLAEMVLAGRWQRLNHDGRRLLLDVAHNRQAVDSLANRLHAMAWDDGELQIVVGLLQDKPIDDTIAPLSGIDAHWFAVDSQGPRGQSAAMLAASLAGTGCSAKAAGTPMQGLQAATAVAEPDGRILIFGSFSVVGAVLNEQLDGIRE